MSAKHGYVYEGFKLPSTDPIIQNVLAWINVHRAVVGDADPPPTLAGAQALRVALTDDRRAEVRNNARKSHGPTQDQFPEPPKTVDRNGNR
jgi:hypothetical protein